MNVAVITAIYDGFDSLKEPPAQDVTAEFICITDNPALTSSTWDVRHVPSDLPPVRAAKTPKFFPGQFTDADITIWIDASFRISRYDCVSSLIQYATPVGQFAHPDRDCVYDEARYSLDCCPKYQDEPLTEQVARYRERGHPEHWGLWAAGVMAIRRCDETVEMGARWAQEVESWSFQDQVSQPPLLRDLDLIPTVIPGHFSGGTASWLSYEGSSRH